MFCDAAKDVGGVKEKERKREEGKNLNFKFGLMACMLSRVK
jgi:hypothetical protein